MIVWFSLVKPYQQCCDNKVPQLYISGVARLWQGVATAIPTGLTVIAPVSQKVKVMHYYFRLLNIISAMNVAFVVLELDRIIDRLS